MHPGYPDWNTMELKHRKDAGMEYEGQVYNVDPIPGTTHDRFLNDLAEARQREVDEPPRGVRFRSEDSIIPPPPFFPDVSPSPDSPINLYKESKRRRRSRSRYEEKREYDEGFTADKKEPLHVAWFVVAGAVFLVNWTLIKQMTK